MKDLTDVLERVEKILYELRVRPENAVIIVEGRKDVEALHSLDIVGEIIKIQDSRKSVFATVEDLAAQNKEVYILTDWDRKGGQLASLLRNALKANDIPYNDSVRTELSKLCKSEIKDVESLPSYLALLKSRIYGQ